MQNLTNLEQQRLIAVAKLCIQFASGHNISDPRKAVSQDKVVEILPSYLEKAQTVIDHVNTAKSVETDPPKREETTSGVA